MISCVSDNLLAIVAMIENMLEKYRGKEEREEMEEERILCNLARAGENVEVRDSLRSAVEEMRGQNGTERALRYVVADIRGGQGESCEDLYPLQTAIYM